jgi:hypothetical protein
MLFLKLFKALREVEEEEEDRRQISFNKGLNLLRGIY